MADVMLADSVLDPLYNILGHVLAFFYSLVPSYGFAIILLTISVRVVLIPLTSKQVKSQRAMQQLQPELKKLQAKHKGDRQKLNEEMMLLYKEHKANPLAGCLPLILQMPLFIVLYRLIRSLSLIPPKHIPLDSELYTALRATPGKLQSFGMDLAHKPQSVLGLMLVALVVATGYYQQKQMTARMPKDAINPQMQMVTKIFPAFFGLISLSVPAGVVLYFIVSNLWQVGQQQVAFRNRPVPGAADVGGGGAGAGGKAIEAKGTLTPTKGEGGATKSGATPAKGPAAPKKPAQPKPAGTAKAGKAGAGSGSGAGGRPPTGRVTPKGGQSGRVTPKGGPGGGGAGKSGTGSTKSGAGAGKSGAGAGKSAAKRAKATAAPQSSSSSDGESLRSRLFPTNRAAKAKRPPPAARPKGLPPTKGSSGGSSRKES